MPVRKITEYPEKVLRNKTQPIDDIDEEVRKLVKDMFETMYLNNGVGLSANQIGVPKRIAVINPTGKKEDELVLINPEIVTRRGTEKMEEGCLSLPGINGEVKRAEEIEVTFLDLNGKECRMKFAGLNARIVQHELDHLNGLLFVNRMGLFKGKHLLRGIKKGRGV
jgi:peptide deformylase